MNRRVLLGIAAFGLLLATGCEKDSSEAKYAELDLAQSLAAQQAGGVFFDVNTEDFREENGKVPGAVLLASSSRYELSLLPPEKEAQLIFYCTSKT